MRIAINSICNSKCPYCFAADVVNQKCSTNITIDNYIKILEWMKTNNDRSLIMLGGEPTIHPEFKTILKISKEYISKYHWKFILLTNGTNLGEYLDDLPTNTNILININSEKILGIRNYKNMISSLDKLSHYNGSIFYAFGINLYADENNYSFFWNLVDKYNPQNIRVSVTTPHNDKIYINNREKYFKTMIPLYENFIDECVKRNKTFYNDCSYIPPCYIKKEYIEKICTYSPSGLSCRCYGKGDDYIYQILPNLEISTCFGCKNYSKNKNMLNLEMTSKEINATIKKLYEEIKNNNYLSKCSSCSLKEQGWCEAGCLGFEG